ncbi:alpha-D-ribose 1-methylphosphonate 5-triphosphate diphosphatase [Salipiger sp. P9]|uniref:alpha-D-ribose 1-methylphosphonate 5-triphosphate diphosphatase n=1 Tax=Salipiger pentaromativorans TaxID=2943193 RepID=UPI0021583806|nr:alpha-D-ribose 1-methylphosphonate 5-triphosphate diphosphatase [Salipiger pentaromativorans]MCR8546943.1 alpha-D-ribose 1-methylphosphonate 5-triphosphate diphosphatase [Salipiger pentaromativorans]
MWLSDFRIVLHDRVIDGGALRLEDGKIAELSETPVPGAALQGDGLLLMPGFVDMHGDMIEREVEPRPNVRMPMELGLRDLDRRLKVAGVTTGYAAVSFNPKSAYGHLRSYEHSKAMLRALKGMRQTLKVDHRVHARFEVNYPGALEVIEELIAEGTVDLVSLTDHTPGQGQYRDLERLKARTAAERGLSAEEAAQAVQERIDEKRRNVGDLAATLGAISGLCRRHGIAVASHDDDTAEKVALMVSLGAAISEFPVTEEAARAARAAGLMTAMGAPNALRGESYSGNLSARAAHAAGLLDILAADYHPSAILPAVLVLARQDPEGLAGAARLATANPARALGLGDRGEIAPGKRADLVIADDEGVGHVRATFRAGRKVFSDGSLRLREVA